MNESKSNKPEEKRKTSNENVFWFFWTFFPFVFFLSCVQCFCNMILWLCCMPLSCRNQTFTKRTHQMRREWTKKQPTNQLIIFTTISLFHWLKSIYTIPPEYLHTIKSMKSDAKNAFVVDFMCEWDGFAVLVYILYYTVFPMCIRCSVQTDDVYSSLWIPFVQQQRQ